MADAQGAHTLPIGTTLNNKWVILEFIAKGGMGEIYRAHQLNLKRDVAIKTISREWLEDISEDPEEVENALRRFQQEVLTMVQIRHPNVLQLYDYESAKVVLNGQEKEIEYIVLEYVPGMTLRDTMREEGFHPDDEEMAQWIRRYFLPVLEGMKAIHGAGIFHRDIKPENVLMDGDIPKIADFGLARACNMASVTCSMEIKGTPAYMAPEQFIDFKRSDQRTDIYALGKILYEAAEGKMPTNVVPFKQASLARPATPFFVRIDEIVRRATAEKPEDRFSTVEELQEALEQALSLASSQPPRPSASPAPSHRQELMVWTAAIALLLALLTAGGIWYSHFSIEHPSTPSASVASPPVIYPKGVPRSLPSPDGVTLVLVPGGTFTLPAEVAGGAPKRVEVRPFYMDETPVTNHQFVNFLNEVRDEVEVRDGAVRDRKGRIWLYLGEVVEGYEPIVYRDGLFEVKNSAHSACPVVRVTGYGAAAYAAHYGKRLPTMVEWLFAAAEGRDPGRAKGGLETIFPASFSAKIRLPYPVMLFSPNRFGIKGLNRRLGCWVLDPTGGVGLAHPRRGDENYAIVAGFEKADISAGHGFPASLAIHRKPWEAFEEVGFRCVKDVDSQATPLSDRPSGL